MPDVGIELGAACMPSDHASDRATAPGQMFTESFEKLLRPSTSCTQTVCQVILQIFMSQGCFTIQNAKDGQGT